MNENDEPQSTQRDAKGAEDISTTDAPTVQRLSGVLSQDVSEQDYRDYLERKYGGEPGDDRGPRTADR